MKIKDFWRFRHLLEWGKKRQKKRQIPLKLWMISIRKIDVIDSQLRWIFCVWMEWIRWKMRRELRAKPSDLEDISRKKEFVHWQSWQFWVPMISTTLFVMEEVEHKLLWFNNRFIIGIENLPMWPNFLACLLLLLVSEQGGNFYTCAVSWSVKGFHGIIYVQLVQAVI